VFRFELQINGPVFANIGDSEVTLSARSSGDAAMMLLRRGKVVSEAILVDLMAIFGIMY